MTWSTRTAGVYPGALGGGSVVSGPIGYGHISHIRPRCLAAAAAVVAVMAGGLLAASVGAAGLSAPDRADVAAPATPSGQPRTLPADDSTVRIAMTENDGLDVIVASSGGVSAPGVPGAPAVRFRYEGQAGQTWAVDNGPGCGGPWTQVTAGVTDPTASPLSGLLTLCVASGSPTVRGTLTGVYDAAGQPHTVNTLPLEQYVADTVPGESPSSWSALGGPGPQGQDWGFQELEAQAVAVRSFVLANPGSYGGYADTCDLTCQTYRGVQYETPESVAAAADTAGQVMVMPGGQIATTEYSASTGGYTSSAAQGSPFTPVPDDGDAICLPDACNPNHHWTTTVSAAAIEAAWPQIGQFEVFTASQADSGHPADFPYGRLDSITIQGSAGSVTVPGTEFYDDLGLKSDLFTVTSVGTDGTVAITGQGWGHGIGMGQWGALGYALGQDGGQGNWTYQQIVTHYYGPASLETLPDSAPSGGVAGYWLGAADGGIFAFGDAPFYGSMGGQPLNQPIVGLAATHDGGGYWLVAADGGIFSFGDAAFYGSMGGHPLNQPIVGMAVTPDGGGYWEVAADGGIFSFGDAPFYGSMGGHPLNQPIVGMAASRGGYWLVAADGGIFSFGDASFEGSTGSLHLAQAVVGMAATPDDGGYWLVAADGGIFSFGDARFLGSAAGSVSSAVGMAATTTGGGYLVATAAGRVLSFGDAPQLGDLATVLPGYGGHVVGVVPLSS